MFVRRFVRSFLFCVALRCVVVLLFWFVVAPFNFVETSVSELWQAVGIVLYGTVMNSYRNIDDVDYYVECETNIQTDVC